MSSSNNIRPPTGRSPFGELLLKLRTERGLTQERIAQATQGDRISSRSITYYESAASNARDWVLPHRPALRVLSEALNLDPVDQHALVVAWNTSRKMRDEGVSSENSTTFVSAGRESAVTSIMDAWQRAQSGQPQVVFIGGIPGIGKTALMKHMSDSIAATTNRVMITWGAANGWATSMEPYLAIRTATDRILVPPDATTTLPGRYPNRPRIGEQEVARVIESIPLLGGALISERALREMASENPNADPATIDSLLFTRSSTQTIGRLQEYCDLVVDLSRSWPIVFVLEDMHWIGEPSASVLLHLARHLQNQRDTPILFLCTYRNDEVDSENGTEASPFTRLLNSLSHSPQIHKITLNDTMGPQAGMAYIRAVLQKTPMAMPENEEVLASWLYAQTSGHPLLTGEMVRHLLETKALAPTPQGGHWSFNPALVPPDIPSAVSSFIEQRLSRVPRKARRLLDVASAMDDVILTEIIADILDIDNEELLEIIDQQLVRTHQLLLPGAPVVLPQNTHSSYRFPHALFREYIYGRLPEMRRKRLHGMIAAAMEHRFEDPDTRTLGEITGHYVMAEDWHSAQIAGYRLAQEAAGRLDWDLATVWFKQAEDLAIRAQDPHQLWRARAARLAVMRGTGQYDDALTLGEQVLQLAQRHSWAQTLALANHHLGEIHYDLGEVDEAVSYLEQAIAIHVQENTLDLAAAGEAMISHATHRQGKYDVARKHALQSLEYGQELPDSWIQPEAMLAVANCDTDLGFYEAAIANYRIAIELAEMVGKLSNQYIPAMNIGLCHAQLSQHDIAIRDLTKLIDQMVSVGLHRLSSYAMLYLALAYEGAGRWNEARETFAACTRARRDRAKLPVLYDSIAGELRVAMQENDATHAHACLTEVNEYLTTYDWEGIEDPLLVKLSVAKGFRFFGDDEQYRAYIEKGHMLLMKRAEMIEDSESARSYLSNVPVNVELQKCFAELQESQKSRHSG